MGSLMLVGQGVAGLVVLPVPVVLGMLVVLAMLVVLGMLVVVRSRAGMLLVPGRKMSTAAVADRTRERVVRARVMVVNCMVLVVGCMVVVGDVVVAWYLDVVGGSVCEIVFDSSLISGGLVCCD